MTTKEPKDAVLLSARIAKAYPSLSAYSAATLAEQLCAIERMQRRHAERCCSGSDGGYVKRFPMGMHERMSGQELCAVQHDPEAEERAEKRLIRAVTMWRGRLGELLIYARGDDGRAHDHLHAAVDTTISRHGDPRGAVLRVRLPGESEAIAV